MNVQVTKNVYGIVDMQNDFIEDEYGPVVTTSRDHARKNKKNFEKSLNAPLRIVKFAGLKGNVVT